MRKTPQGNLIFSPSDLIVFLASPFASWMDRCHLEFPDRFTPDPQTEEKRLVAETGDRHEAAVLTQWAAEKPGLRKITKKPFTKALEETTLALAERAPVIYQAALQKDDFAGYADFLELDGAGRFQVWDTKLARSPRPYYLIQLCCYAEMLEAIGGVTVAPSCGIILGNGTRVRFALEDCRHYYRQVRDRFRELQAAFDGNLDQRPEPQPRADHGRWDSLAEQFFQTKDHLVQVAGISTGQIRKLQAAGIHTLTQLAHSGGQMVARLAPDSLAKLAHQARLQLQTRAQRLLQADAPPAYELLPGPTPGGRPSGLARLPSPDPGDVFFDMEGFPLVPGGLEYLFGAGYRDEAGNFEFRDWWAHDRAGEKRAFEGFIDWVVERRRVHPQMHIYHYAAYEVSAVRRLSISHATREEEVDNLLRQGAFVDLYRVVREGLRVGEGSYSIKKVELLYRPKRQTEVATAGESIVQYARWMESGEPADPASSSILGGIRAYNRDDCLSTLELADWLRRLPAPTAAAQPGPATIPAETEDGSTSAGDPSFVALQDRRAKALAQLEALSDPVAVTLSHLLGFHRREQKPVWWRLFDRAESAPEELWDDPGCLEGLQAVGTPQVVKRSQVQSYSFDPLQEAKLDKGARVYFSHQLAATFEITHLDYVLGELSLKISTAKLNEHFAGAFPREGSLLPQEVVQPGKIPEALVDIAEAYLRDQCPPAILALLRRQSPVPPPLPGAGETVTAAAERVLNQMAGGCLGIQGPPGTGKTWTAAVLIADLLRRNQRVGISSNSHKAIMNLLRACGARLATKGRPLQGIKVGGDGADPFFLAFPAVGHVPDSGNAHSKYEGGVVAGTAWLFSREEWVEQLDYLFIEEAGQVSLANAVAMTRCARNLVLLGDQMQLEQPVQGCHPGDAGLSVLHYLLKDTAASQPDAPVFHAVIPGELGLFLGESYRMHPDLCRIVSESIYEGRLRSAPACRKLGVARSRNDHLVTKPAGLVFSPVAHNGDVQSSLDEAAWVRSIWEELCGAPFTDREGKVRPLQLDDFLFIAPYNAQVRLLKNHLPTGAKVGSVDKFQGQEAPVCILSLCSSQGEYGSRGLGFILDRNRINVALSRAQCLAVVVADPRIASSHASTLGELFLLNLFCKLLHQGGLP